MDRSSSAARPQCLFAGQLVVDSGRVLSGGAAVCVAGGTVLECVQGWKAAGRRAEQLGAELIELGPGTLTPGLVNAHSHLELFDLAGQVPASDGFGAWVGRLMAVRAGRSSAELAAGIARGARRMVETGTTTVGDIDSLGLSPAALAQQGLRVVQYREAIDAGDPERTSAVLAALGRPLVDGPSRSEGLAPHAPFTVSPPLMAGLGELARRRGLPVTVHWSETEAELLWLAGEGGPLGELLGAPPGPTGLELIDAAGLLGPGTSLVHGNLPAPGEVQRIAGSGASVVHCPGSHRFFDRGAFPLQEYRSQGVPLGLGTDSAASNADLDMRREMALMRSAYPELEPGEIWSMGTEGGARALGLGARIGKLIPGFAADLALFSVIEGQSESLFDALTLGGAACHGTWLAGSRWGAENPSDDAAPGSDR